MRFLPMRKKRFSKIHSLLITLLVMTAGCATANRTELCSSELPELDKSAQDALLALSPWTSPSLGEGRMLASASAGSASTPRLSTEDRAYWRKWAETRLFAVQTSMDLQESERRGELRKCLSSLANELVTFHGYATQGRADRMEKSLKKISELSLESRKEGCP